MKKDKTKLSLKSLDIKKDKIEQLKKVFPEAVTQGKIDFNKLKRTLGEEVETDKERYGMQWPGKSDCFKIIQQPSIGTLKPAKEESVNFDKTENLFIEGDNLEVLKLLQKSYYGKVKMIYIDPPYNTGNDFVYPDDFSETLDTYLKYTGQVDAEGKKFSTNPETSGRFHSKWMNMMYPRLYLAKNLLINNGMIFISIDDNELNNLIKICDEIFGENNFIATFVWKTRQASGKQTRKDNISPEHEYILVYSKAEDVRFKGLERDKTKYSNPDNDPRGIWQKHPLDVGSTQNERPNCFYTITDPETGKEYSANPNRVWRFSKERMQSTIDDKRIIFDPKGKNRPSLKKFWSEFEGKYRPVPTYFLPNNSDKYKGLISSYYANATKLLNNLFSFKIYDYSKPVKLLKSLIEQTTADNDIVMDFFAGSASTAHATLNINKDDSKKRKFIMIQLPEPTKKNSDAFKAGFKNIADIGKERIRRVIKRIKNDEDGQLFKKGGLDLGFKVFKLSPSNFKIWNGKTKDINKQLKLQIDHIDKKATKEDLLFEILLKTSFKLTTKIEELTVAGKKVYSIEDGAMFVCLEDEITRELIDKVSEKKPMRFVCLDSGFKNNDQLKTNAVQILKTKDVEFRTV